MKRSNKLYEASAILRNAERTLSSLNRLKFDRKTREYLAEDAKIAYRALETLQNLVDKLIENETGLTEAKKWENAAKNLGVAK